MEFDRNLSSEMIAALNSEYENAASWWHVLADHQDVFIAIRKDYLNVYRKGCSIAKVELRNGSLVASINYKFLLKKNTSQSPYVECHKGIPATPPPKSVFIPSLTNTDDIEYWTDVLGGIEKSGVHSILRANRNIVDTEIAFRGDRPDEAGRSRIDFAAIQEDAGRFFLRFFEAKDYSYRNSLRAGGKSEPEVIEQLRGYEKVLESRSLRSSVLDAYKKSIRIASRLNGRNILGKAIAPSCFDDLQLDTKPRLVVFGYDADQENGKNFEKHMSKLRDSLRTEEGLDRLLLKGSPKDFAVGISTTRRGKAICPIVSSSGG